MAKKLQRIVVGKRRFAFTYGATWLGVKEYNRKVCKCGDSPEHHNIQGACCAPGCACKKFEWPKLLNFAVGRPPIINHRIARELIEEKIGIEKRKGKKK